jgi:hypothetical protein
MKVKTMFLLAALAVSGILNAESVDIPVLYRNPAEVKTGELHAFGFYENKNLIVLAFQIKDLQAFASKPKTYMSFYADVDDDLMTGRYPKALGWDFQVNLILTRKAVLSLLKYKDAKSPAEDLTRRGSTVSISGNTLFISIPKSALAGIKFKEQFKFRTLQFNHNKQVNQKKTDGVFAEKFELPANY